ncbi:MAG: tRNA (adenosine(37)-N6)-dimethylallyltransferase MiaA [Smithellaceae bacterium]
MKSKECSNENKTPVVVIGSPTATGKTCLAIELAKTFGGEIIGADSMQVYRYLDIGTAKPTPDERREATHHLIDVVDPDCEFNAALYADLARACVAEVAGRGRPVFVAGGTGLYIRALLCGIIETPPVDEALRNYFRALGASHGNAYLFDLLRQRDPAAAGGINKNDVVRIIRALEVLEQTGESIIALRKKHAFAETPYRVCKIGLQVDRSRLKDRIIQRTQQMTDAGFEDEVRTVLGMGYSEKLKSLQSLGYKQMIDYIGGRCSREEALERIGRETWRYAKRQMTWFAADREIQWFWPDQADRIKETVTAFFNSSSAES